MFLSKLMLRATSREVQRDLSDRYELHRTLMRAFPETLSEQERVLYRIEENLHPAYVNVLVQSLDEPDWAKVERLNKVGYLATVVSVRRVDFTGPLPERTRFRLQANPTVKREGKRHAILKHDALVAWLINKGEQHGFTVSESDVIVAKLGKKYGKTRQQAHRQVWHVVQFDGILNVTNSSRFQSTLLEGIGSAKAFGCGLLSIPYRTTES